MVEAETQAQSLALLLQILTCQVPHLLGYCPLVMPAVPPTRSQTRRPFPAPYQTQGLLLG